MQGGFSDRDCPAAGARRNRQVGTDPLYVWLPDAMEGPTPVSALIHAATMVTAGVYMIVRSHAIFDRSPFALSVVAIIGAVTALFAATMGMVQTDIKRVLAYSTISQLGYMFLALRGCAAYSAAIFHLVTHASSKACSFSRPAPSFTPWAGSRICMPWAACANPSPSPLYDECRSLCYLRIAALLRLLQQRRNSLPVLSFSNCGPLLWFVGIFTALLTAFYMFRLWYLTFFGDLRTHDAHPHESPWSMLGPLVILGVLALAGGWIGIPKRWAEAINLPHFLDPVVSTGAPQLSGSENQERLFSVMSVSWG